MKNGAKVRRSKSGAFALLLLYMAAGGGGGGGGGGPPPPRDAAAILQLLIQKIRILGIFWSIFLLKMRF